MKVYEVKSLIAYDIAAFVCFDDEKFVHFHNFISQKECDYKSNVKSLNEQIYKKMELKQLKVDCFQLANLYLTMDQRLAIYKDISSYFFNVHSNDKSPLALKKLEEKLKLDKIETLHVREDFFKKIYLQQSDFTSVVKGMLSYFWICFANDGQLDKYEWDYFKSISLKLKLNQKVAIQKFDLSSLVKFTSLNPLRIKKIKDQMLGAAKSDGVVKASEIGLIKKIVSLIDVSNIDNDLSTNLELLMTLSVLISDEKLTETEKNWFLRMYKSQGNSFNINEAFIFLDIVMIKYELYRENIAFFNQIWGMRSSNYHLVLRLYIAYSKYYLKADESKLNYLVSLLDESDLDSLVFAKNIKSNQVTKEELMILYGVLTSDFYSLKKFNAYLDYSYFERIFVSINTNSSKIEYYFTVCALLVDKKVSGKEYDVVWQKCAKLNLDFSMLESTIKEYSLLNQKQFNIDTYFTYLRSEAS